MRRVVLPSARFLRAARRLAKKHPGTVQALEAALDALGEDASQPSLKTHKLKGKLKNSWACSIGYDLRIAFRYVQHEGAEAILLQTVGTHDEVY